MGGNGADEFDCLYIETFHSVNGWNFTSGLFYEGDVIGGPFQENLDLLSCNYF